MANGYTGEKTLSGTWGEVWIDGDLIFELKKISSKITVEREDVQFGLGVDSKMTKQKGEGSLVIAKIGTRFEDYRKSLSRGEDKRAQIIAKLADPDAVGKQAERYSIDNVWFNELPFIEWEKGGVIEEEIPFGFNPLLVTNLDKIAI